MKLEQFAMERMQSTYENEVAFNLSESGVQPLRLGELLEDAAALEALLREPLRYTQTNGTRELRALIASHYPGAALEHVQITNGGAEANYIATFALVEPDDEIVFMAPNYMQTWGLARAFGGRVREWPLARSRSGRWTMDVDLLERLTSDRTKLIVLCNPNNPTGVRFDEDDLDRVAAVAARHGTWILADEIYRGAERDGRETPSMWGRTDRVLVTGGLSKAYGLPGLRIGWVVGPPALVASLWAVHDYTTIAPGALSDALARHVLGPERRRQILARTRRILNDNYPIIERWLDERADLFDYAPPDAGAIVYVHYRRAINSTELVTRLRIEKSVLIVPGDHFGMDHYLRLGYGDRVDHLRDGLERLGEVLAESLTTS
jgi:aspartate/methionine/tyrosine aminotransferase